MKKHLTKSPVHNYFKSNTSPIDHPDSKLPLSSGPKPRLSVQKLSPVRYVWESSIPSKWLNLADPSHFINIGQSSKSRNTLRFLEETQKYIYKINQPQSFKGQFKKHVLKKSLSQKSVVNSLSKGPAIEKSLSQKSRLKGLVNRPMLLKSLSQKPTMNTFQLIDLPIAEESGMISSRSSLLARHSILLNSRISNAFSQSPRASVPN